MVVLPAMGSASGARLWIGCLAGAGMFVGHLLAAAVGVDPGASQELMLPVEPESFHVPPPALAALVAVVVSVFVGSAIEGSRRSPSGSVPRRFIRLAAKLAVLQVTICGAFCAVERLWFGDGLSWAYLQHEALITIAVQVLVAAGAALILTLLERLILFIGRVLADRKRRPSTLGLGRARPGFRIAFAPLASGAGVRGPPFS